jgi:hypothetical protein
MAEVALERRRLDEPTRRLMRVLMAASLAAAAFIAMSELNRLIASVAYGSTASSTAVLYGPGRLTQFELALDAMQPWVAEANAHGDGVSDVAKLLIAHVFADFLFIAAYTWLFAVLVWNRARLPLRRCIVALVAFDVLENVLASFVFLDLSSPGRVLLGVMHFVTALKVLAVIAIGVQLVWLVWDQRVAAWAFARRVGMAVKWQRFSLAVLVLLAALMTGTQGEVQEQLPDVQRSWVQDWTGARHGVLAALALAVLTVQMLYLGRLRTARFAVRTRKQPGEEDRKRRPNKLGWILLLAAAAGFALIDWTGDAVRISYTRLLVVVLIPVGLVFVSWLISWLYRRGHGRNADVPIAPLPERKKKDTPLVLRTGDVLAGAVVTVAGIGLIRSFVAPLSVTTDYLGWSIVLTLLGFVLAVGVWPFLWEAVRTAVHRAADRLAEQSSAATNVRRGTRGTVQSTALKAMTGAVEAATVLSRGVQPERVTKSVGAVAVLIGAVPTVLLLLVPLSVSSFLGVAASVAFAIGALTALLTWATLFVQTTPPREVFRPLRFRVTPVITVAVLIAVVAGALDSPDGHHSVRTVQGTRFSDDRDTLEDAFTTWAEERSNEDACLTSVPGTDQHATPMVLVAAAGGGIRAAWWTATSLGMLTSGACGENAVFLSSGVSGGSLGLAVADVSDDAADAVDRMIGPDALAAGAAYLLTGDLVHGFTGVSAGPFDLPDDEPYAPGDRAALMEIVWERDVPALSAQFAEGASGDGRAGELILNSTSVTSGCRVFVSTIEATSDGRGGGVNISGREEAPTCGGKDADTATGSYDLLRAYFAEPQEPGQCLDALRTTTAAMISARFPYVTPTGVTDRCNGLAAEQLVDGGYAEGSGLSTLADIAPRLMQSVREHNADVFTGASDAALVVPFIVFLENHFRLDLRRRPPGTELETIAPLVTKGAAARQLASSNALLQRVGGATRDWLDCPTGTPTNPEVAARCNTAVDWARRAWPGRTVIVAPGTEPRVEAPLGWVLSELSKNSLQKSLDAAAVSCEDRPDVDACPTAIWRLNDLKDVLDPA